MDLTWTSKYQSHRVTMGTLRFDLGVKSEVDPSLIRVRDLFSLFFSCDVQALGYRNSFTLFRYGNS